MCAIYGYEQKRKEATRATADGGRGEVCGGESRSCCRKKKTLAPLDYKWTVNIRRLNELLFPGARKIATLLFLRSTFTKAVFSS